MSNMKLAVIYVVLTILLYVSLQVVHADTYYPVQVKAQATTIKFSNIKVTKKNKISVLSGIISRRSYNSHVFPGHLDLEVLNNNNEIIYQSIIKITGLNLRRNRYGRQFIVKVDNELPEASYFKLSWHNNHL